MEQPEDFHPNVLARNSTRFAEFLTEANAALFAPRAQTYGITVRRMVELQKLPDDNDIAGRLGIVDSPNPRPKLDHIGRPVDRVPVVPLNENGRAPTRIFDHYELIFYAFYGRDIGISGADIATALEDAVEIIHIAEYLGLVPVISKPIDVALFKQGQMIFKEAIIHLSGNWSKVSEDTRNKLEKSIREICEKHHKILNGKRRKLELTLAPMYLSRMCTPSNKFPIKSDDFAKNLSSIRNGRRRLHGQIDHQPISYKISLTKKAMNVLGNHLLEIKECIKGVVAKHKILESTCQLDVHRYSTSYLTCVEVDREDYPWLKRKRRAG
ncbi:hypothetical protein K469DRAFT_799231 [Zopfia rhizophila CBS 207.26]|uniref:Uncharacterized protein n=1 Tax=Zopfia rhizophila CBS 207.26 TaxID=1314779 RepID=A0A6A6DJW7_9PEZI|nr:hypothetical protein K469DRAFT_799231 [Zopfia rhizophila CBS 207.26]